MASGDLLLIHKRPMHGATITDIDILSARISICTFSDDKQRFSRIEAKTQLRINHLPRSVGTLVATHDFETLPGIRTSHYFERERDS